MCLVILVLISWSVLSLWITFACLIPHFHPWTGFQRRSTSWGKKSIREDIGANAGHRIPVGEVEPTQMMTQRVSPTVFLQTLRVKNVTPPTMATPSFDTFWDLHLHPFLELLSFYVMSSPYPFLPSPSGCQIHIFTVGLFSLHFFLCLWIEG